MRICRPCALRNIAIGGLFPQTQIFALVFNVTGALADYITSGALDLS